MTYKVYWRLQGSSIARWAIFGEKEDAEMYMAMLKDARATVWMVEIPQQKRGGQ